MQVLVDEHYGQEDVRERFLSLIEVDGGVYLLAGKVSDRVRWAITVEDPNTIDKGTDDLLPTEVMLYPTAHNPFNSTITIHYFLPNSAEVRMTA